MARQFSSPDSQARARVRDLISFFASEGWGPVVLADHIGELVPHPDKTRVREVCSLFAAIPSILRVDDARGTGGIGSFLHMMAREVIAVKEGCKSLAEVASVVKSNLVVPGTGSELASVIERVADEIRPQIQANEARADKLALKFGRAMKIIPARERKRPISWTGPKTGEHYAYEDEFAHILKCVTKLLGLSEPIRLEDIPQGILPSRILSLELRRVQFFADKVHGNDLNDNALASLACYVDLTIVDKRTEEYIRQIKNRSSDIRGIIGKTASISGFERLPELLNGIGP